MICSAGHQHHKQQPEMATVRINLSLTHNNIINCRTCCRLNVDVLVCWSRKIRLHVQQYRCASHKELCLWRTKLEYHSGPVQTWFHHASLSMCVDLLLEEARGGLRRLEEAFKGPITQTTWLYDMWLHSDRSLLTNLWKIATANSKSHTCILVNVALNALIHEAFSLWDLHWDLIISNGYSRSMSLRTHGKTGSERACWTFMCSAV